ncbi:unnamed protein product, partial [marine sediment metagenome]
ITLNNNEVFYKFQSYWLIFSVFWDIVITDI